MIEIAEALSNIFVYFFARRPGCRWLFEVGRAYASSTQWRTTRTRAAGSIMRPHTALMTTPCAASALTQRIQVTPFCQIFIVDLFIAYYLPTCLTRHTTSDYCFQSFAGPKIMDFAILRFPHNDSGPLFCLSALLASW